MISVLRNLGNTVRQGEKGHRNWKGKKLLFINNRTAGQRKETTGKSLDSLQAPLQEHSKVTIYKVYMKISSFTIAIKCIKYL